MSRDQELFADSSVEISVCFSMTCRVALPE
jgi:hypothetical protein